MMSAAPWWWTSATSVTLSGGSGITADTGDVRRVSPTKLAFEKRASLADIIGDIGALPI